jgi:hypothetical protein
MKKTIEQLLNKTRSLGAALLITAGSSASADTNWYISTDQTGAQTQIDTNHFSSWIFTLTNNMDIWGGDFLLKDGPKTTADITFSLYLGALTREDLFSGTNAPFRSVVLSNQQFKQQNPTDQQYNPVIFRFGDAPVSLSNSITYTAALASPARDTSSYQYFIKGGTNVTIIPAPEPATYFLLGMGLLLLIVAYGRKTAGNRGINGLLPCVLLAGLVAASPGHAAGFDLGGASSYDILLTGNGGQVTLRNSTNVGNIGVGSLDQLTPSLVASNSLENGRVDFADAAIVASSGSTVTGGTFSNITAVNMDFLSMSSLSASLGTVTGTSLSINLSGGSQTILAGNGFSTNGNRVFDVSTNGFNFSGFSTLTIDGQNLGQSVVLNFKGFGTNGWGLGAGNIVLTGGLTPDQVLWNTTGSGVPMGLNSYSLAGDTTHPGFSFSGVYLDPLGQIDVDTTILHGRLFGGNDSILITNSRLDSIPEPSTYALLGLGLLGILVLHHHRRQSHAPDNRNGKAGNIAPRSRPVLLRKRVFRTRQCWM